MLKIIILLKRWHNDNIVIKRWSRTSLVSKTYILSVSIIFFLNEYCWLFVYFISFLVYVSNRTMIWHFLMMWKLRFKKNLVQYASQTCIRLVLSRNLNSYPSLIGIEKSKCLLLTNWSVIDLNFFFKNYYLLCDEVTPITFTPCPKLLSLYSILGYPQFLNNSFFF